MVKWRRERSIVDRVKEGEGGREGGAYELEPAIRSSPDIVLHAGKAPGNSLGNGKRVGCLWVEPHVYHQV